MKGGTKGSLGFVYFIKPVGLPGPIKIGFSATPQSRLRILALWSPIPLEIAATIPGTRKLEINIQECLARSHSHYEWFFPTDEVVNVVKALCAGRPIENAIDLCVRHGRIRKAPGPQKGVKSRPFRGVDPEITHAQAPRAGDKEAGLIR